MPSNVFLELQGRQWRQVEGWNVKRLGQFAEERALLGLRKSWCCRSVVKNKQSTLALAFSCDGSLLASSHLTHEILVYKTRSCISLLRILSAHPATNRSPWCLTFHPSRPHHLLSGCLGGSVLLWDVQAGKCLFVWQSGVASPINSLVVLPTHPDHFLVACDTRLHLLHHRGDRLGVVWSAKTAAMDVKVRLVLHHPESSKILTAVTNITQSYESSMTNLMRIPPQRSSYRLQMYTYGFDRGPDLENSSMGLISMAVRVLSPQSVVLTSRFVISSSVETAGTKLSIHSVERNSFGQCLFSTMVTPKHSKASTCVYD
ncbi:Activating molecule in BECN1-regulated autophagy protein 1 [Geodia barretti]|uniref:Activating molecule in BECN1-regulated autophagy protein 1 n=1 Tax=Geodia barretti TaxID=519541 RepID=A0AA35RSK8_GEOBA|nr:Activating molecule in BECN1-regulated autophagy protein 1 [Geodia barretti]